MHWNYNIFKLIVSIQLLIVLILADSCKENDHYKIKHIKDTKCVEVPFNCVQLNSSVNKKNEVFSFNYLIPNKNVIGIYRLDDYDGSKDKKIIFKHNKQLKTTLLGHQFFINSMDSIYFYDSEDTTVYLYDSNMNILDQITLSSKYYPVITKDYNFLIDINNIYYCWLPSNTNFANKLDRISYYKNSEPVCVVKYSHTFDSVLTSTFGNFPETYVNKGSNYYSYFPYICIGNKRQLILSYNADDYIYIYRSSHSILKKECSSNYVDKFTNIPDNKFKDMSYIKEYIAEEPKYLNLYYDSYKNLYYRIVRMRFDIYENNINNAKWSIIIMDDTFKKLGEVLVNYSEYFPDIFLLSEDGVYLKKTPMNEDEFLGDVVLSLVQFTI